MFVSRVCVRIRYFLLSDWQSETACSYLPCCSRRRRKQNKNKSNRNHEKATDMLADFLEDFQRLLFLLEKESNSMPLLIVKGRSNSYWRKKSRSDVNSQQKMNSSPHRIWLTNFLVLFNQMWKCPVLSGKSCACYEICSPAGRTSLLNVSALINLF